MLGQSFEPFPEAAEMQQARLDHAQGAYAAEMLAAERSLALQAERFPGEPQWTTEDYYPGGPAATRLAEGAWRGRAAKPGSEILGSGVVGYSAAAGQILDEVSGQPMGLKPMPAPQEVTEAHVEAASNGMRMRRPVRMRRRGGFGNPQAAGHVFGQQLKAFLMGIFGR
jgi:hypothetical protein